MPSAETIPFEPGIELAQAFYDEVVKDLVACPHVACLLGEGSEVLGFDQPRSTDHEWGPRLQLLVEPADVASTAAAVEAGLPERFHGFPVRFRSLATGRIAHHIEVTTADRWLEAQLGVAPVAEFTTATYLALSQQRILHITAGAVFHDDRGELTAMRERLAWYPHEVWLWMIASQWHLISNVEALAGRSREAGDPRGQRLACARLVRLLMEMCFLQERRYWPYAKWFGSAFSRLEAAATVGPLLDAILDAPADTRQETAGAALQEVAGRHNRLGVTAYLDPSLADFVVVEGAVRPYRVLNAIRFVRATRDAIMDPALRNLDTVGAFDQLTHADDLLVNFSPWPPLLQELYQRLLDQAAAVA